MRAWLGGLLFEGDGATLRVELHHALALRRLHGIGEDGGALLATPRPIQHALEALPVEEVVAKDQGHVILAHEPPPDDEGLSQSLGLGLHCITNGDADAAAIAEEPLEAADVFWRGDEQDVADAREHERRERVVHHRLVVDGQELLAHGARDREEPRPGAAGENDSLLAAEGRHVLCRVSEFRAYTSSGFANTSSRRCHTGATLCGDPRGQRRITHADRGTADGAPYVADGSGALRGGGGARQHALRGGSRRGGASLATARAAGLGQGVGLACGP